jgi:hypothetical protein
MVVVAGGLAAAHDDYAIIKVLHQLVRGGERSDRIRALDAAVNFSGMKQNEILYIVGHGNRDTGEIRGVNVDHLITWLNHGVKGIPANIGGIHILTCYGGRVYGADSTASTIAGRLRHHGIPVKGATGFAYGTPETISEKLNSVLPMDLTEFYNGSDENAMLTLLRDYIMPVTVEHWEQTFIPHYNGHADTAVYAGQRLGSRINDGLLTSFIRHFISTRNSLETKMRDTLRREKKGTLAKTLNALINQGDFRSYVQQQYDLHQFLFEPVGTGYVTTTS